jgi:hypothetical protein
MFIDKTGIRPAVQGRQMRMDNQPATDISNLEFSHIFQEKSDYRRPGKNNLRTSQYRSPQSHSRGSLCARGSFRKRHSPPLTNCGFHQNF